jgi:probable phosphoglycerate mutase
MINLFIARHGNTFGPNDVVTRVGGRTDLPLVESGMEQGLALGHYFLSKKIIPDLIYTSKLQRTIQTAQQIQSVLRTDLAIQTLEQFNEIDYGIDENKPEDQVVERLGMDALKEWDEHAIVPKGWHVDPAKLIQSWCDFAANLVESDQNKTVLIVSSNGIIRFAPYITNNFESFRSQHCLKVSTGALCHFVYDQSHWSCKEWNVKPT